jgi:SAM-dependent methyltransferase
MNRRLLRTFLQAYPFQPATAVWRASEVDSLCRVPFPDGLGLDLGCGDGKLTRILEGVVGKLRLVGVDVDPLETALAMHENMYERVHTSRGDQIPEPDASFDFVLSVSVLEHVAQLEPVLAEVARLTKPGGRLIVTVPAVGFHRSLRGPWFRNRSRDRYLADLDRRVAHLRYWSAADWRRALLAVGFQEPKIIPIMSPAVIKRWELISRMTAGLLHLVTRGKSPIEIQRSMGLRGPEQRMPAWLAGLIAPLLSAGVRDASPSDETVAGCILVIAERRYE